MKVTINIDCTPEEARTFFGLPDVQPLQAALMAQLQDRVENGLKPEDMERLFQMWMTGAGMGLEQLQKLFWSQMGSGKSGTKGGGRKSD